MANRLPPQNPQNQLSLDRAGFNWLLNEMRRVVQLNANEPEPVGAAYVSLALVGHAVNFEFDSLLLGEFHFLLCSKQLMPKYLAENYNVPDQIGENSILSFMLLGLLEEMEPYQAMACIDFMLEHEDEIDYARVDRELEFAASQLDARPEARQFLESIRSKCPQLKKDIESGRIRLQ